MTRYHPNEWERAARESAKRSQRRRTQQEETRRTLWVMYAIFVGGLCIALLILLIGSMANSGAV